MEYRADKSRIYSCFLLSAAFSGLQFFIVEGAEAYGSIDISGKQEYNVCKRGLVKKWFGNYIYHIVRVSQIIC